MNRMTLLFCCDRINLLYFYTYILELVAQRGLSILLTKVCMVSDSLLMEVGCFLFFFFQYLATL